MQTLWKYWNPRQLTSNIRDRQTLDLIRGPVADSIGRTYPAFN